MGEREGEIYRVSRFFIPLLYRHVNINAEYMYSCITLESTWGEMLPPLTVQSYLTAAL